MSDRNPVEKGSAQVPAAGSMTELIREFFSFVSIRGKEEVGRVQERSRHQLELRQLRRDRSKRLEKLGREAMALVQAAEIEHPGLGAHLEHIQALDLRIESLAAAGPTGHDGSAGASEE
jgi:hypothetical protein